MAPFLALLISVLLLGASAKPQARQKRQAPVEFDECSSKTFDLGLYNDATFTSSEQCRTDGDGNYPNDANWNIAYVIPEGAKYVNIDFLVSIEDDYNCNYDKLTFGAGRAGDSVQLCGLQDGQFSLPLDEDESLFNVTFTSDYSVNADGIQYTIYFTDDFADFPTDNLPRFNGHSTSFNTYGDYFEESSNYDVDYTSVPWEQFTSYSYEPSSAYSYDPSGYSSAYSYDPSGYSSAYSYDPSGYSSAYSYDPYGYSSAYSYDPYGYSRANSYQLSSSSSVYSYELPSSSTAYSYELPSFPSAYPYDELPSFPSAYSYELPSFSSAYSYEPFSSFSAFSYEPFSSFGAYSYEPFSSFSAYSYEPFSSFSAYPYEPFSPSSANSYEPFRFPTAYSYELPSFSSAYSYEPFTFASFSYEPYSETSGIVNDAPTPVTDTHYASSIDSDSFSPPPVPTLYQSSGGYDVERITSVLVQLKAELAELKSRVEQSQQSLRTFEDYLRQYAEGFGDSYSDNLYSYGDVLPGKN